MRRFFIPLCNFWSIQTHFAEDQISFENDHRFGSPLMSQTYDTVCVRRNNQETIVGKNMTIIQKSTQVQFKPMNWPGKSYLQHWCWNCWWKICLRNIALWCVWNRKSWVANKPNFFLSPLLHMAKREYANVSTKILT